MKKYLLATLLLLTSCSSSPDATPSSLKVKNQKGEFLYRTHEENLFVADPPNRKSPDPYPWEHTGSLPKITKDYFRCKGSGLNPERLVQEEGTLKRYYDCGGSEKHSLPARGGKEAIYPILIDLVNYIQTKTNKRVVITCGHRCPEHNAYADSSKENQYSKHMIGAEVSFYVQGMESQPDQIVALIQQYYKENPQYKNDRAYTEFHRYEQGKKSTESFPLYNKEIFLKSFTKDEGRNFDNRHPYPYVSIQVRYDRDRNEKVVFSWDKAHREIIRF